MPVLLRLKPHNDVRGSQRVFIGAGFGRVKGLIKGGRSQLTAKEADAPKVHVDRAPGLHHPEFDQNGEVFPAFR